MDNDTPNKFLLVLKISHFLQKLGLQAPITIKGPDPITSITITSVLEASAESTTYTGESTW